MSGPPLRLTATPSQTIGPFFHFGLADDVALGCLVRPDTKGDRIRLSMQVLDGDGLPVSDAMLELWQADADGRHVRPNDPAALLSAPGFCGFGRLATDDTGMSTFDTIRPGRIVDPDGRVHASHVDVCVFARGLLRQLYTRVYFEGDPDLDTDVVLALVPSDRKSTLIARPAGDAVWRFEIRLQGEAETVFFDL